MEVQVRDSEARVLEILRLCDAYLEGHFRYTSGRHGKVYFEKIRIVQKPALVDELGRMMADLFRQQAGGFDAVISPAYGAIVFGYAAALHLGKPFAFLQRDSSEKLVVRPGFTVLREGSRALLVEDVATTGGSLAESIDALAARGVSVTAAGILVDRTGGRLELTVPWRALLSVQAESWQPEECPLCRDGVPLTVPGSSGKQVSQA
jgi:orotate phosphoribosyltransferase